VTWGILLPPDYLEPDDPVEDPDDDDPDCDCPQDTLKRVFLVAFIGAAAEQMIEWGAAKLSKYFEKVEKKARRVKRIGKKARKK
jgi:hypothetical protein